MSAAELSYLDGILAHLQPTQESIKAAKDWIMDRARLAPDVVDHIKGKIGSMPGFEPRLHTLYLVNDLLLHSSKAPQDHFGPALQRSLFDLCHAASDSTLASPDQRLKVTGLVDIWKNKNFYSAEFLDDLKAKLESDTGTKRIKTDPWAY